MNAMNAMRNTMSVDERFFAMAQPATYIQMDELIFFLIDICNRQIMDCTNAHAAFVNAMHMTLNIFFFSISN